MTHFEDKKGESETLGGFLIELFGRIPNANEEMIFEPFIFKVQSVDTRRIKKIKATIKIEKPIVETENLDDEK